MFRHIQRALLSTFVIGGALIAVPARAVVRFQTPLLTQIGHSPDNHIPDRWNLATGDLNEDGRPDLVAPAFDSLAIYLGRGNGTFEVPLRTPIVGRTEIPVIADFDGDGHLDIAWGAPNHIGILFGDGTGHAWTPVTLSSTDVANAVVAGDFDGDGVTDLAAVAAETNSYTTKRFVRCFLSRPGRSFDTHSEEQPGIYPWVMAIPSCDINEDGKADFVIGSPAVGWSALVSDGDGTFTRSAGNGGVTWGFDGGDVTGDGHVDIVAVEDGLSVVLLRGRGNGTFDDEQYVSSMYGSVDIAVSDVNGDGILDLTLALQNSPRIVTMLGMGGGSFGSPRALDVVNPWNCVRVLDVDGDERPDFVGLSQDELVTVLGDGDGSMRRVSPPVSQSSCAVIKSGDFDRDGRPDLAIAGQSPAGTGVRLALSRPGRQWELRDPVTVSLPQNPITLVADLDEDGWPDVLVLASATQLAWLRGSSGGALNAVELISLPAGSVGSDILVADINRDGHLDLVYCVDPSLRVLPGDGHGGFGPPVDTPIAPAGQHLFRCALGDLNADGHLDAAVLTGWDSAECSYFAMGDGTGAFSPQLQECTGGEVPSYWYYFLGVGDVDGDGADDVVTQSRTFDDNGRTIVRLQHPGGVMGPPVSSRAPGSQFFSLVDIDGDGKRDVVTTLLAGFAVGFWNGPAGVGSFEGYGASPQVVADFDGDGRLDVIGATPCDGGYSAPGFPVYYGRESVPPSVALVTPASGPTAIIGLPLSIQWQATDDVAMGTVDLLLSRHGRGGPFQKIVRDLPNSGEYTWAVTGPPSDSVAYKVVARDAADNVAFAVSASLGRISSPLGVDDRSVDGIAQLSLGSARPTPIRDRLRIDYTLPHAGDVSLRLFDLNGRLVSVLLADRLGTGRHTFDQPLGPALGPGVYFLSLELDHRSVVSRLVVLR